MYVLVAYVSGFIADLHLIFLKLYAIVDEKLDGGFYPICSINVYTVDDGVLACYLLVFLHLQSIDEEFFRVLCTQ